MKVNYSIAYISILLACQCQASNPLNHLLGINQGRSNTLQVDPILKKVIEHDSYDVSKLGPCEVCCQLSSKICSRCKKVFYCSSLCQKKNYQKHDLRCSDYYHDEQNVLERNEYNIYLNHYDSLSCLQYYSKDNQAKCVTFYIRQLEKRHNLILPQDIKGYIFLIFYDYPQDQEFGNVLRRSLKVNDAGVHYLRLNNKNPMYLIRFLQYIYQKEDAKQVVDKSIKKCLFQKIAHVNWILGALFCFPLQRKLIMALMKVMKKEDYSVLRAISNMGYSEINALTAYYPCEIDAYCTFFFMLEKGEKKALQYASLRGWHTFIRKTGISNKKFLPFCERTTHYFTTCCSNTIDRGLTELGQDEMQLLSNLCKELNISSDSCN